GSRVQSGGGYKIEKNLYEFVETASDPDRLKPHLNGVFVESDSAEEERNRLLSVILQQPAGDDGWRSIFMRVLQEGASLRQDQVKTRLRQLRRLGVIELKAAVRNPSDGPYGPKGQFGPIGILMIERKKKRKASTPKWSFTPEQHARLHEIAESLEERDLAGFCYALDHDEKFKDFKKLCEPDYRCCSAA